MVITAYGDYIVRLSDDMGFDDNILDSRKKMIKALNRRLSSKGYPYAPAYHFASRDTISASSVVLTAMEYIEVDDFMRMRDRKEINDIFVKAVKSVKGLSIGTDGISFDDIDIDIHEFRMLSEFAEDARYDDCGDDTPVNDFCSDMNPLHLEDDSKWLMAEYGIAFESGFFERQPDIPDDEDKREELCQNMADEMTEAFDADYYGMLVSFISNSGMKLIDGGSRIRIAGDGAGTADMHCYSFIMVPSDMDIDEASKLSRIAFRNFDAFISGYGEDTVMLTGVNITEAKIRPLVPGKFLRDLDRIIGKHSELPEEIGIVDDMSVVASISTFPTIMGERIFLKIYKPPKALNKIITNDSQLKIVKNALDMPGVILVCGSPLSGKTHVIYSLLLETASKNKNKNIMTLESIAKYNLGNVNQCELNENIGFNMDKASRFIEFQSPDIIYLEGIKNKESFDYFSSLVYDNKTIIMEFLANNMEDLRNKMAISDFETLKSIIGCIIFIHSKNSIEVFDKETAQKYLA